MSLCDKCYAPGACCKRMYLLNADYPSGFTFWDDVPVNETMKAWGLPFVGLEREPAVKDAAPGRTYSRWWFSCPNLLPNGRCGDYKSRPEVCRIFEPASGPLCVHYRGAEGTGDGL